MSIRAGTSSQRVALSLGTLAMVVTGTACVAPVEAWAEEERVGQIIILRPVPRRPATRPGVPGPPFAVKTSPPVDISPVNVVERVIVGGVTNSELLRDVDIAAVRANAPARRTVEGGTSDVGREVAGAIRSGSGTLHTGAALVGPLGALGGVGNLVSSQARVIGATVGRLSAGLANAAHSPVLQK